MALFILLQFVIYFAIAAGVLFGITYLFKIPGSSYWKSILLILLISSVSSFLNPLVSLTIGMSLYTTVAALILVYPIFHFVFNLLYKNTSWSKTISIYFGYILLLVTFSQLLR